ncbi:NgoMIV family type II restriction endonuclease [Cellulomonas hominis]|uniref:NgoMIV family type II restriction endonuclease n=1 Tax=Cellulomonas hominis TaxID=156981 RepID=UPI001BCD66CA|nr:NgoMIV family type II restriction endonuclease [Cellulomonas hominis]
MPASFAKDLCKVRANGKPNTSDASDKLSVAVGEELFRVLGVNAARSDEKDEPTGAQFAHQVAADLMSRFPPAAGTVVLPERKLFEFDQYRHVGALRGFEPGRSKEFIKAWKRLTSHARKGASGAALARVETLIGDVESVIDSEAEHLSSLLAQAGDESLLGLDLTVSRAVEPPARPQLAIGLSLKWSLRTDRAQDCRSQGAKMSALRRGRMPHFGVLTMEPRPYMLNLLGGGSGDVDCVYHLDLPALTAAVDTVYVGPRRTASRDLFHRLVEQRRVRDYDELVAEIAAV